MCSSGQNSKSRAFDLYIDNVTCKIIYVAGDTNFNPLHFGFTLWLHNEHIQINQGLPHTCILFFVQLFLFMQSFFK